MMAERERVICTECGADFWRDDSPRWRIRCLSCRKRSKNERPAPVTDYNAYSDPRAEIGSDFKPLLCHPDRHGNSEEANRVTAWLLKLRN